MESWPQNPEFRNDPENFHPCLMKVAFKTGFKVFLFPDRKLQAGLHLCCLYTTKSKFIQASLCKIQGLLKELPTVFKDLKLIKKILSDLHVKILLRK